MGNIYNMYKKKQYLLFETTLALFLTFAKRAKIGKS